MAELITDADTLESGDRFNDAHLDGHIYTVVSVESDCIRAERQNGGQKRFNKDSFEGLYKRVA